MAEDNRAFEAEREKKSVAMNSVFAAIFLTAFKVVIGVVTGSLGIIAEAAHSSLDLVAALVTYFAVRIAGKPADEDHPFGHGKFENLSAFIETLLLLGTCVWIIHESYVRLFVRPVEINTSVWAFAVMGVSIIVDVTRSRMLLKAARKHHSQALEADALHFSTDIWSSAVVIFGLACVALSKASPDLKFLGKADAAAAFGVAMIVVYVSVELGVRTVKALVDSTPEGMPEQVVCAVESIPGVANCHKVRVRTSGPHIFIDIHVLLDGGQTLERAHETTEIIERKICALFTQNVDVTVHPEPIHNDYEKD